MLTLRSILPLTLVAAASVACGKSDTATKRTRPPPLVQVARVAARDVPVTVRAPVDLRPLATAEVGSKTLGYLDAVLVDRGDRVRRGQLLATVRPSDLPDQLTAERSALAQIQANVALARSNFERAKQLAPDGLVSQQELQQATTALAAAEAAQSTSQARIGALATRLGETRIDSPLDGMISVRRLDPGALVGPGGAGSILTVVRTDVLRVFVAINERDAQRVRLGQDASVELDALPGRTFAGKVVRLAPAFDPGTRTLDAEVQLPNPDGALRPGMYGRGTIVLDVHSDAAVAPVAAVVIGTDERFVYVVEGDKVRRRVVGTGVDGGDWLEITSGLKAGEEIVTAGVDGLSDGATVRAARPKAAGEQAAAPAPQPEAGHP